jgi:hypothetical protein
VNQLVSAITSCCATFGHWQLSSLNPTPGNRSSRSRLHQLFIHETHSSALDMTGAEAPPGGSTNISSQNQATEQPSTPNSKASPSASGAPCPSPLLHIKRLPTVPRRALIARYPGPQINHTRLRTSHLRLPVTPKPPLFCCAKEKAPSTSTSPNIFIALSHAHRITQAEQPSAASAEPTPPPCCQKVGFSSLSNFQFRKVLCISLAVSRFLVCSASAL